MWESLVQKSLIISLMLLIAFQHLKSLWHKVIYVRCGATVRSRKKDFFSPLQTLPIAVWGGHAVKIFCHGKLQNHKKKRPRVPLSESCGCQMLFVHQASYPTETYDSLITLSALRGGENCLPLSSSFLKISHWEHCVFSGLCGVNETSRTNGEVVGTYYFGSSLWRCARMFSVPFGSGCSL